MPVNPIIKAQQIGRMLAKTFFNDYKDPRNRSETFSWKDFPEIASEKARKACSLTMRDHNPEVWDEAASEARRTAESLLKETYGFEHAKSNDIEREALVEHT